MADDTISLNLGGDKAFMNTTEMKWNFHEVHLDEPIDEPIKYRELISALFNASEDDQFSLYINNAGGYLNGALAIIEAIKATQAHVTAVVVGECHSAASLITMYCHSFVILDSASSMIHTVQYGASGTTGNVKAYTDFTTRIVEKLLDNAYEGFLTPEELVTVKLGVELWLDADEIRSRMERRVALLTARAEAAEGITDDEDNGAAEVADRR